MTAPAAIDIRRARDTELEATVRLRWRWTLERGIEAAVAEAQYVARTAQWARDHATSHLPHVAVASDGEIVGMAWLALTERVPTVTSSDRWSGDLQSCYVLPSHRGAGIGGRLVDAVLATASGYGAEHVTVHATAESARLYARHGFRENPRLLWAAQTPDDAKPRLSLEI